MAWIWLRRPQVVHADPAAWDTRPIARRLQHRHARAVLQASVGVRMRLCVGGEVAVRNLGVAGARAIADVERGCGHTVRTASRALYGAA